MAEAKLSIDGKQYITAENHEEVLHALKNAYYKISELNDLIELQYKKIYELIIQRDEKQLDIPKINSCPDPTGNAIALGTDLLITTKIDGKEFVDKESYIGHVKKLTGIISDLENEIEKQRGEIKGIKKLYDECWEDNSRLLREYEEFKQKRKITQSNP